MSEFPGFGPGQTKPPPQAAPTRAWTRLLTALFSDTPGALARSAKYRRRQARLFRRTR